jgi:hypothetical protein
MPKTSLTVAPGRSIEQALASVPEGGRLLLKPGLWREHLFLRRGIEIVADGPPGSVTIESDICLTAESGFVTVRGLRFRTPGISVQVWGATLHLASCALNGRVDANSGELIMSNCELMDGELDIGPLRATIEDCRIVARDIDGVLQMGGDLVIRRSEISHATKACIEAGGDSLLIEDCDLSSSPYGILASGSHAVARRCVIHDVTEAAILLVHGGSVDDDRRHPQVVYRA